MSQFILGDYIFNKKRIGKGAFSTIYKAEHKYNKKIVAIKEVALDNLGKVKDSIKSEFMIIKNMDNKNIIKLHDVFFDNINKNIYIVLDYHQKGDMSNFLNGKPLREIYAKKYMRQLSNGLEYLFNNKILHRDLKLQNLLISDDLNLIITDFGFARYFDNDNMLYTICGSPLYMAPEILLKKKYNNKSDLWSVGIIFFEFLTGSKPFKSKNMIDLINNIKTHKIIIPHKYNNILSNDCKSLLLNLLIKNPNDRIDWNDFFNHIWFSKNEILNKENALLDFSITDGKIPSLNNNDSNEFLESKLYKHVSIYSSNKINKKTEDNNNSNYNNDLPFEIDIDINNNSDIDNDIDNDNLLNNSNDSFKSLENSYEENYYDNQRLVNENTDNEDFSLIEYPTSKPIPIKNNKMFYSNNFSIISSQEYKYTSNPCNIKELYDSYCKETTTSSFPDSLKTYIKSSINFLKLSYKYLSK